ncbi:MAG: PilZ domain-containing protein [Myxococcota bacterium]
MSASDGSLTPPGGVPRPESRGIHRIPIRLAVSRRGRSAPLGTTRDISLRGAFIETTMPLPIGTVVPLSVDLAPNEPPLELRGEVVRVTDQGMGLQFDTTDRSAVRRLKKWIIDRTSVQGTQRQVEQLHDQARTIEPIRAPARILALLERIRQTETPVLIIPIDRLARDRARLVAVSGEGLRLSASDPTSLVAGEEVYALAQLGYDAYSFGLRVRETHESAISADLPDHIVYSERRTKDRMPAEVGTTIRWPAPWDPASAVERPVLERSKEGLSFRVAEGECLLAPGAPLPEAVLALRGHEEPLLAAEVRHITRMTDPDGSAWLRVGVSFGVAHETTRVESASSGRARGPLGWLRRLFGKARVALSYGFHKGRERLFESGSAATRVTIPGEHHNLVGLLDRTRDEASGGARLRAPLVLVVPGFAGRKEQMAFFAGTLVEGFARHHQDIAVLRFDGSNNLGESGRDPECVGEGMQALHYTTSGQVRDILAALAWARKNPYVDPTQIIMVSVSMGSIGVRHALTMAEAADVGLWVSYMGAPDAIDVVRLVSGNIDLFEYWKRGQKLGIVSLNGVLTDGDRFWEDLHRVDIGDPRVGGGARWGRSRPSVVRSTAATTPSWTPRRVRQVMTTPAPGARGASWSRPTAATWRGPGDEAVTQFVALTRRICARTTPRWIRSRRRSASAGDVVGGRVEGGAARGAAGPRQRGGRTTLDPEGLGFDVMEHAPEYRQLMDRQAAHLLACDGELLDLGAGTGYPTRCGCSSAVRSAWSRPISCPRRSSRCA